MTPQELMMRGLQQALQASKRMHFDDITAQISDMLEQVEPAEVDGPQNKPPMGRSSGLPLHLMPFIALDYSA